MMKSYYPNLIQGKTKSWIDVYVMNKLGSIQDGKPIYPMFVTDTHVAKEEIPVAAGYPLYIGLDFGLTPAATMGQKVRGRWFIQDEVVAFDMGIVRFAEVLREQIATRFSQCSEAFPAPSNSVDLRLESVSSQLTKMAEGKPAFLVDRRCTQLIKGFEGGYQYRRMEVSGERYADKPDKNMFSHIHDALQYQLLGAGEGRALMSNQNAAKPVIAKRDFDVFAKRSGPKRRQGLWARM